MINRKPVTVSGSSHGDMANSRLKETARPFRGCWLIAGPRLVAVQAVRRRRCRLYLRGWRYDPDKLRWSRDLHDPEAAAPVAGDLRGSCDSLPPEIGRASCRERVCQYV